MDSMRSNIPSTGDILKLIRLSRDSHIAPDTRELVQRELSSKLEQDVQSMPPQALPNGTVQLVATSAVQETSVREFEMRLRFAVQADRPWRETSNLFRNFLSQAPEASSAAKFLEMAFVTGKVNEVLSAFEFLMSLQLGYCYLNVHAKVRDLLVLNSANEPVVESLLFSLLQNTPATFQQTDNEIAFQFCKLTQMNQTELAWGFYGKHMEQLVQACVCDQIAIVSPTHLLKKIGVIALELGYEEDARKVFANLPEKSRERDEALQLLLAYEIKNKDRGQHKYFSTLQNLQTWTEKLQFVDDLCEQSRQFSSFSDFNRPALNAILKTLDNWLPKAPVAWDKAAALILRHADLSATLPGILSFFSQNVLYFHDPALDAALWQHLGNLTSSVRTPESAMLKLAAAVHLFVARTDYDESDLWTAISNYENYNQSNSADPRHVNDWHILLHKAQEHCTRSAFLIQPIKEHKIACLRIANHGVYSPDGVIDTYLASTKNPSRDFIIAIANKAWQQQNILLFLKIAARYSRLRSLPSEFLEKIWLAAVKVENHDLAWRVATLQAHRGKLSKRLTDCWEISGEKRSAYLPQTLAADDFEVALDGFPTEVRTVLRSLTTLGPALCRLSTNFKRPGFANRPFKESSIGLERHIQRSIDKSGLKAQSKTFSSAIGSPELTPEFNALMVDAADNAWTYTLRSLVERLSLPTWNYRHTELASLIRSIGYDASRQPSQSVQFPTMMGKWIGSLSSTERSAWSDLTSQCHDDLLADFNTFAACYCIRLAILVYPSHYLALKTLKNAKASEDLLRDLEGFLLSSLYTSYRQRHGIDSRVQVSGEVLTQAFSNDEK